MKNSINIAEKVINNEIDAIKKLLNRLDNNFEKIVQEILNCEGKVIIIGVGKSGHVGRKISSTLSSTGTPSYFLHPSEAVHGDLGIITSTDIILLISNSGQSNEIINLLPIIKKFGVKIISLVGNTNSTIARQSDYIFDIGVKKEACPLDLAPTSSTTVTLVIGDALAVSLLEHKKFEKEDFALRHPGGILGKKLLLTVNDLMHKENSIPLVTIDTSTKDLVMEMTSKNLGVVGVTDNEKKLIGIVTDGDLRRGIERFSNIFKETTKKIMAMDPITIEGKILAVDALNVMEKHNITSLFVMENERSKIPVGIIHIHDILKAGIDQ
ncbi:MAG: KpsF/GutQ family sugar-phosphate isomerase [Candidatus Marinimicrobia bacterium]|nr:KpsF/GutQ family sugar-phosphate isomerase [Candidatus Neomarinimicrobiota bacterium]